jgi:hypothetical protein
MENWKYTGILDIYASDLGRIGRLLHNGTIKIKKQSTDRDGYARLCVWDPAAGRGKHFGVHRLVAMAFLDKPTMNESSVSKIEINHLNFDKKDNRPSNLQWCTHSENCAHQHKERKANYKLSEKDSISLQKDIKSKKYTPAQLNKKYPELSRRTIYFYCWQAKKEVLAGI